MCNAATDLYDEVFVGNLAGMCMKKKLSGGQDGSPACGILPPM